MAEAGQDAVSGSDKPVTPESNIFEQFDVQRNEGPVKHRMKRFYFKYYCRLSYCFESGRSFKTYDALKAHRKSVHRLSEEENKILPNGKYLYEWVEKGKPRPHEVPVNPPRPSLRELMRSQNIPGSERAELQKLQPATPDSNIFMQFEARLQPTTPGKNTAPDLDYHCLLLPCFDEDIPPKCLRDFRTHRKNVHNISKEEDEKILPNGWEVRQWIQDGKHRPYKVPKKLNHWVSKTPILQLQERPSHNEPGTLVAESQRVTMERNISPGTLVAELQRIVRERNITPRPGYMPQLEDPTGSKSKTVGYMPQLEYPTGIRSKTILGFMPQLEDPTGSRSKTEGYMPQLEDPTGSRSETISHTNYTSRDAECSSEAAAELELRDMSLPHSSSVAVEQVQRPGEDLNCSKNLDLNPSNTCNVNNNSVGLVSNDEVTTSTEYNHHGAQDFDTDQFLDFPEDSDQDYGAELENFPSVDLRESNLFHDQLDLPPASADSNVFFQFDFRKDNTGKLQFVCLLQGCHGSWDFYESPMELQRHRREVHEQLMLEDIPPDKIIKKWTLHGKPRPCTVLELQAQQPTCAQLDQLDHENWLDVARVQNLQPATLDSNIFKHFDVLVKRVTGRRPIYRLYCLVPQCFGKGKPIKTRDLFKTLEFWGQHRAKVHGTSEEEKKCLPSCKEVSEWMKIGKLRPFAVNSKPQPKKTSLRERLARNEPGSDSMQHVQRPTQNSNIFEQFDVQPKEDQVPGSRPDFDYFCLLSPCVEKELPATTLHLLKLHRNSVHNISEQENNNLPNGRDVREWVEKGKQRPYEVPVHNPKPYSKESLSRNQWNLLKRHAYMPQREPGNDVETFPGARSSATTLDQPVTAESNVFFQFDAIEGAHGERLYFCLQPPCNGSRSMATRRSLRQHRKELHKNVPLPKLPKQDIIDYWYSVGKPRPYTPEVQNRRASKRARRTTQDAECSTKAAQRNCSVSATTAECDPGATRPEEEEDYVTTFITSSDRDWDDRAEDRADDRAEDRADDRADDIDDHTEYLYKMDWAFQAFEALVRQENLVHRSTSMEEEETGMGDDEVAPPLELMHTWNTFSTSMEAKETRIVGADEVAPPLELMHTWNTFSTSMEAKETGIVGADEVAPLPEFMHTLHPFSERCKGQSIGVGHQHLGENAQEYTVPNNLQGLLDILDKDEEEILGSTMNADEKEKLRSIEKELLSSIRNPDEEEILGSTMNADEKEKLRSIEKELLSSIRNPDEEEILGSTMNADEKEKLRSIEKELLSSIRNPDEEEIFWSTRILDEEILRSTELSNWEANDFQSAKMNIWYHFLGY